MGQVKTWHSLSPSDKLRLINEWKESPCYGWMLITLQSVTSQATEFAKVPPKDIEALCQREQALGELNGLTRFDFELEAMVSVLVDIIAEEKQPQEEEQKSED